MAEEKTSSKVMFEKQKRIGIITLNNGEMNVFDRDQVRELLSLIIELESNAKVRAIVIQGSGTRAFSAGFDLKNFDVDYFIKAGQEMIFRLYNLPKPTIALVHGYCIGIAFLVAMACDFRYATEGSQFSLPEMNIEGMFPTHGGCTLLPKLVRKISDAKLILYTGDRFPTSKVAEMGLIDERFAKKEEMFDAGIAFAKKLAAKSPIPMALTKVALKKTEWADLKTGMAMEIETIPLINRPHGMKKAEQLEKVREYIKKYSIEW